MNVPHSGSRNGSRAGEVHSQASAKQDELHRQAGGAQQRGVGPGVKRQTSIGLTKSQAHIGHDSCDGQDSSWCLVTIDVDPIFVVLLLLGATGYLWRLSEPHFVV